MRTFYGRVGSSIYGNTSAYTKGRRSLQTRNDTRISSILNIKNSIGVASDLLVTPPHSGINVMAKNTSIRHLNKLIALTVGVSLNASADMDEAPAPPPPTCEVMPWSELKPVQAPTMLPGASWSYVAGEGIPPSTLTLTRTTKGQNVYVTGNGKEHVEIAATYTERVPARRGKMALIRFPLKAGDTWEDEFEEEGEFRSPYEHHRYAYKEKAHSKVLGLETIDVAAGRFRTLHIVREAGWIKSNPKDVGPNALEREGDPKRARVTGWTITHLWYAPTIGRAVMKASMRIGDPYYLSNKESILGWANTTIVELQSFEGAGKRCADKPLLRARQPEMYVPIGYPAVANNTWQWSLQMREHRPRRAD